MTIIIKAWQSSLNHHNHHKIMIIMTIIMTIPTVAAYPRFFSVLLLCLMLLTCSLVIPGIIIMIIPGIIVLITIVITCSLALASIKIKTTLPNNPKQVHLGQVLRWGKVTANISNQRFPTKTFPTKVENQRFAQFSCLVVSLLSFSSIWQSPTPSSWTP